ncbi:MAG TPA: phosphatidylserine decarboxylase [Candidatus Binataceae bacterium]|nr:phosphatidylserine decarboxylase [Candidatus Binataceae bacterium]
MAMRAGDLARRVGGTIRIAAEGVTMAAAVLAAGVLALVLGWQWAGAAAILCGLAIAAFFRDPERSPANSSASERLVFSGADGTVSDVAEMPLPDDAAGERYHRVSVFMSPLNVHVNRAPVGGEIMSVRHTPGAFHAAFRDYASEQNERNLIVLSDARGRQHAMMQIAGYLARRIVCRLHPHDTVRCGERIGLIMFGSRVDHFIPPDYRVVVKIGERVRAGESIIGELLQ